MTSTIGDKKEKKALLIVGLGAVFLDLFLAYRGFASENIRWVIACAVPILFLTFNGGNAGSIGLKVRPIQGWLYWIFVAVVLGLIVVLFSVLSYFALRLVRIPVNLPTMHPDLFFTFLAPFALTSPIIEEFIYRMALCAPLTPRIGVAGTVVVSGVTFALLHVIYRNVGPDNLIAGFLLGWAYLKSGTILVPIGLHSLGNIMALAAQVLNHKLLGMQ